MEISPYLSFDGRCREAFDFYAAALGGTIETAMSWGESPMAGDVSDDWRDKILHISLACDGQRILGSDAPPNYFSQPEGFSVALSFEDLDRAASAFARLAEGGTVKMAFGPTFWAKGFGMAVDRFGIPWIVNGPAADAGA